MSKTFCPLPWKEISTSPSGSIRLCCTSVSGLNLSIMPNGSVAKMTDDLASAWNTDFFQETRKKMLEGNPVSACANCYREEANGHTSPRLHWLNKFPDFKPDPSLYKIDLDQVEQLDLRLGKNCNLQCRMCGPYSSSSWAKTWRNLGDLVEQPSEKAWATITRSDWAENLEVWEKIKFFAPKLRRLYLTGGEPFLVAQNKEFLKYCVETGEASHIELRYSTNGTIWDPELPALWAHFKKVKMNISIDGMDEVNNYIRYPSRWSLIMKNLDLSMEVRKIAPLEISIRCAVQAYNIFNMPELISFIQDKGLSIAMDFVHQPTYLSVAILSEDLASKAREKLLTLQHPEKEGLLNALNSSKHHEWEHFISYTKKLDAINNQSVSKIIPELGI